MLAIDAGFSPKHLSTAEISLPDNQYATDQERVAAFQDIGRAAASLAGINRSALSDKVPFGGRGSSAEIEVEVPAGEAMRRRVEVQVRSDATNRPRVAVVNRALARMLWPDQSAIGRRFKGGWGSKGAPTEVVGVIADMRGIKLDTPPAPTVYLPFTQVTTSSMFIVARSPLPARALETAITEAIKKESRSGPIHRECTNG